LLNFPIIIFAICVQIAISFSLVIDPLSHFATDVHTLYLIFPPPFVPLIMFGAAVWAVVAFIMPRKLQTILCLVPQQLLLYLSAGGAFEAIWVGHYADGVQRGHAHLFADQCPIIFLALFHTWAMTLIMIYGED